MTQSNDKAIAESSNVILGNILYHAEYRDVFVMLLRNYKEPLQSFAFLQDVILMTHVYIQLMDGYCRSAGRVVIQKKRKARNKKTKATESLIYGEVMREEEKMSRWEGLENQVAACVGEEQERVPCVVNENTSLEEQRCM